ncbi:hypothetical protein ACFOY4_34920 [Actinomadura syzygii]|nr:hypothetical protein [Actinomadura syzygii]
MNVLITGVVGFTRALAVETAGKVAVTMREMVVCPSREPSWP